MTIKKLRVAVIGTGKMGLLHASILNTIPEVDLVALCDKSTLIRKFSAKLFSKIKVVSDVKELLPLNLDVVYITTPIPSHYFLAKEIYSNQKPTSLFVEKTLAANSKDAQELCSMVKASKAFNMVGYMKRFAVTFRKAKEILDQETIGTVSSFEAHAYSSDFFGVDETSTSQKRGGVLNDLGSHVIDLALWFFGDLQVLPITLDQRNDFQNTAHFSAKNEAAIEGSFDVSWCQEGYHVPDFELIITGSKGKIQVDDDSIELTTNSGQTRRWFRHDLNDNVGFLLGAPEYYREDEHFIKSILDGINPEPSFITASKVDQVIEKVIEGAEKK